MLKFEVCLVFIDERLFVIIFQILLFCNHWYWVPVLLIAWRASASLFSSPLDRFSFSLFCFYWIVWFCIFNRYCKLQTTVTVSCKNNNVRVCLLQLVRLKRCFVLVLVNPYCLWSPDSACLSAALFRLHLCKLLFPVAIVMCTRNRAVHHREITHVSSLKFQGISCTKFVQLIHRKLTEIVANKWHIKMHQINTMPASPWLWRKVDCWNCCPYCDPSYAHCMIVWAHVSRCAWHSGGSGA